MSELVFTRDSAAVGLLQRQETSAQQLTTLSVATGANAVRSSDCAAGVLADELHRQMA